MRKGERTWRVVFHLTGEQEHTDLGQRERGSSEEVEEAVSMEVQVFLRDRKRGGEEEEAEKMSRVHPTESLTGY